MWIRTAENLQFCKTKWMKLPKDCMRYISVHKRNTKAEDIWFETWKLPKDVKDDSRKVTCSRHIWGWGLWGGSRGEQQWTPPEDILWEWGDVKNVEMSHDVSQRLIWQFRVRAYTWFSFSSVMLLFKAIPRRTQFSEEEKIRLRRKICEAP